MIIPQQTFQPRTWLAGEAAKTGHTVEQFLDEVATDYKAHPDEAVKNQVGIDISPYVRCDEAEVNSLAEGLKSRGIQDDKVVQAVLCNLVNTAVLAPLLEAMTPHF